MKRSKRTFDILFSILLLLFLSPLFLVLTVLIWLFLGRPIIFAQRRPGFKGELFNLYKFRTMTNAKDRDGNLLPDKERLTAFGRFLRKTSLDELPELWNVLKGEMSFVGPRPLLLEYLPLYTERQARRHDARPGITGLAQISGRNNLEWEDRFELDIEYIETQSLMLDVKILLLTLFKVISGADVEKKGHSTMTKFEGSSVGRKQ